MAFREVRVYEIKEVLRLWLRGTGTRKIGVLVDLDRKTVQRYIAAATEVGLGRGAGEDSLDDALMAQVCERARPRRRDGHGETWAVLGANHDQLKAWLVDGGLTAVKATELLARKGVVVPERTVQRYALKALGVGRSARTTTVRVADCEPGSELQVDFGKMGLVPDPVSGRNKVCWALIFTACYSRHCFVWLSFRQSTEAVIAGFEAAWAFFEGVFKVVIPDNMATVVDKADPINPRLNQAFVEYAQTRGFVVDPARVRKPTDKPRVERVVPFVRGSFFAGENFIDLADAQRRAEQWCRQRAGQRVHGTTAARPAEVFAETEAPCLLPAPLFPYDLPIYANPKVHRDHYIEVARALYSMPGNLIGQRVEARADRALVRVYSRGTLVKTHPRQPPGGRSTDPADFPAEKTIYAMRDLARLQGLAASHGAAIGAYAKVILDDPLPWRKMRQVYALLGLVKKWGAERVETACEKAADAEAFNVGLIGRMLERATEGQDIEAPPRQLSLPGRFARPLEQFAIRRPGTTSTRAPDRALGDNVEDVFGQQSLVRRGASR
ncbi:MAG TPA: IS21 family transposase [Acidimicrobiales bacterium]|nr:IS21 family transposase [Acidimicrobiales bacterium]